MRWRNISQSRLSIRNSQLPASGDWVEAALAERTTIGEPADFKRSRTKPFDLTAGKVISERLSSAAVAVDRKFQRSSAIDQIKSGRTCKRIIKLVKSIMIADRVRIVEKRSSKIGTVPANQIDDATCAHKID